MWKGCFLFKNKKKKKKKRKIQMFHPRWNPRCRLQLFMVMVNFLPVKVLAHERDAFALLSQTKALWQQQSPRSPFSLTIEEKTNETAAVRRRITVIIFTFSELPFATFRPLNHHPSTSTATTTTSPLSPISARIEPGFKGPTKVDNKIFKFLLWKA